VAVIGSGPAGFYAAGALVGQDDPTVTVDMFDRLPAPYGLVRYGVAPDHEKIRNVLRIYRKTLSHENVRFFGNVEYGTDLMQKDLLELYDYVVFSTGAPTDRSLGIPGEDLKGSLSATEFVAWYNGHPDFVDLDVSLDMESVVVVGVGNVAIDVARILARSIDELKTTDIADYALEALAESRVRDIHVLGRRGPAQAKFTNPEIREFGKLEVADAVVRSEDLVLDPLSQAALEDDRTARKNLEILRELAETGITGKPKRVHFRFLVSPVEILGDESGRMHTVRIEKNELRPTETGYLNSYGIGAFEELEAGMILRSVGYRGLPLPEMPYNKRKGTVPNEQGRVVDPESGETFDRLYVAGWAKRGPTGVIGTNKADAVETVASLLEDARSVEEGFASRPDPEETDKLLKAKGVQCVSYDDWCRIEALEEERGEKEGRPRVKFLRAEEMLEVCST
jgi:ferredoxin--NADP+ reductase